MNKQYSFAITLLVLSCMVLMVAVERARCVEPVPIDWVRTYKGPYYPQYEDCISCIAAAPDGGFALGGYTKGSSGSQAFWLVKADASGIAEWMQTYSVKKSYSHYAHAVAAASDGGYVLAGEMLAYNADHEICLIKTDSSGHMEWNRTFSGGNNEDYDARSVVQARDGGYVLAGEMLYPHLVPSYLSDAVVIKVDASGETEWNRRIGGGEGGIGGMPDTAYCVIEPPSGGYTFAGSTENFGAVTANAWLVHLNDSGDVVWSKIRGESTGASSVIWTADGGYALAGAKWFKGSADYSDFYFAKTDSEGNMQWNRTYGTPGEDSACSVVQTTDGGYALAGYSKPELGAYNIWLVKTDEDGIAQWNQTYPAHGYAYSMIRTGDGGYAVGSENSIGDGLLVKFGATTRQYNITVAPNNYTVSISSNSSITEFEFSQSNYLISFNVTGLTGDKGYCKITIPTDLLWGQFTVLKNGVVLTRDVDYSQTQNATHATLHLTYMHSTHKIEVIGTEVVSEFPSFFTLPLALLIVTLVIAIILKKREAYRHNPA